MHPRTLARERHQSANPAMAGVTQPAFQCSVCGERRSIRGGYSVSEDRRQRICCQCKPKGCSIGMTVTQIMHKIENCNTPGQRFAVIVRDGGAILVKANTDKFRTIERLEPEIIAGVYDIFADEDTVRADLAVFGVTGV